MIHSIIRGLSSLRLTVLLLGMMAVLTICMTLEQVESGLFLAKQRYFEHFWVWVPISKFSVPIFPGGRTIGILLVINLIVAHFTRFKWTVQKIGMWLTHIGLIVLLLGAGYTSFNAVESQMVIQEGQTVNFSESPRAVELAITRPLTPTMDRVVKIPEAIISGQKIIKTSAVPFEIRVLAYYPNSRLEANAEVGKELPHATTGIGKSITAFPMPIVTRDDYRNVVTAIIEVVEKGKPLGVYLVSNGLGAPQGVEIDGVTYQLQIRPVRHYFPYYIQLIEFVQEYYPDTNVPKNYASKVRVIDPHQSAPRDVTIYMNNPLRYDGNAHYQASFGEDGKSTVLQVVSNPGWQVPYVACVMISIGLIWHFGLSLSRFLKRRTQS